MPINKRNLVKSVSLLLLLLIFVAGCKKTALYHGLTEHEANEMIVILYSVDIDASKEKEVIQNEVSWNVLVDEKDLPEARKVLVDRHLPRIREMGLSGVYKDKGLIPTPDEQKARYLLAIKGEIVNMLEDMPEVVDADVVINVPTPEEFADDKNKRPTASVFVKVRSEDKDISQLTESKVQQHVANAVENLNPRDVSVILSYMSPSAGASRGQENLVLSGGKKAEKTDEGLYPGIVSVAGVKVSADSAKRLKIYLSIFFAILILMSAILVVNVIRTTRMKQDVEALTSGERPLIEGEVAEQLESGEEDEDEEL